MVPGIGFVGSSLAGRWDGGHMWGGGNWMWLWGTLMMVFWAGVIGLIAWLIIRGTRGGSGSTRSAREILSERYARGEIDTEEYHKRTDALR